MPRRRKRQSVWPSPIRDLIDAWNATRSSAVSAILWFNAGLALAVPVATALHRMGV